MVPFDAIRKQLRMIRCGAVIAGAIAASLCGGIGFAQDSQSGRQNDTQRQSAPAQGLPVQALPAPGAQSQTAPPPSDLSDAAKAMIGTWEFSNADHDRICHFTFRADAATAGYRLDIDKNCPNLFPSTANIVAWLLDNYGDLRLLDAAGKEVVELSEVEGGMYDGFTPEEGRYILQTTAAAPTLTAADMVGNWAVARGAGKPVCVLTLANSPAGDALALTVEPGCDPFVMRFAPSAWRIDEGALVLLSAHGQNWQFEENDAKTWQRVPETADPILLLRQ